MSPFLAVVLAIIALVGVPVGYVFYELLSLLKLGHMWAGASGQHLDLLPALACQFF